MKTLLLCQKQQRYVGQQKQYRIFANNDFDQGWFKSGLICCIAFASTLQVTIRDALLFISLISLSLFYTSDNFGSDFAKYHLKR